MDTMWSLKKLLNNNFLSFHKNKMIKALFISFAFLFLTEPETNFGLNGTWDLVKIEMGNETLFPKYERGFHLTIKDSSMIFNREMNRCFCKIRIDKNTITSGNTSCTKVAEQDPISNYLDYSGAYILKDSLLTLTNKIGKIYLVKARSKPERK